MAEGWAYWKTGSGYLDQIRDMSRLALAGEGEVWFLGGRVLFCFLGKKENHVYTRNGRSILFLDGMEAEGLVWR